MKNVFKFLLELLLDPFGKKRIKDIKRTLEEAKAGDAEGQFYLGMWHSYGYNPGDIEPIPEDKTEAMKWFRKAAEQGHLDAHTFLGDMYFQGDGVPQDCAEAVEWYRKPAEQGDDVAQFKLGEMYEEGKGVQKDMTEATKWIRKAAEQGHEYAKEWLEKNAKEKGE
jgi:TPR repeat protein